MSGTIEFVLDKAEEFGKVHRQSGWHLAWLVVSSCVKQNEQGGRPKKPAPVPVSDGDDGKVSTGEFAKLAGVSVRTVKYYYHAWEIAASKGQVPKAKDVANESDWKELLVDYGFDEFDESEDPEQHWSYFYQLAKKPKPAAKKEEPQSNPQPKQEEQKKEKEEISFDDIETKTEETEDIKIVRTRQKFADYRDRLEGLEDKISCMSFNGPVTDPDTIKSIRTMHARARQIMEKCDALIAVQ